VRNLVSNAIKFSPRNEAVQIQAFYDTTAMISGGGVKSAVPDRVRRFKPRLSEALSKSRERLLRSVLSEVVAGSFSESEADAEASSHSQSYSEHQQSVEAAASGSPQGALVIVVTDRGVGISAENQKKLFKSIIQFSPEKTQGTASLVS
jgi:signal transduction histidine kinase